MINNLHPNINFFQAANMDGHDVAGDFVIRLEEFNTIMAEIHRYPMKGSVQHYLLLGKRGSGKSTLLKRIEHEILTDETLSKQYIPINPAEEQANIYRLMDLWEEVIRGLKHFNVEIEEDVLDSYTEDSTEYNRALYSTIQRALKKANKKIILLLDNIDRIFENLKDDAAMIREVLLNYDDIRIIGGSTRMSEHFWKYDQPFYNFFRVIRLESLSSKDVKILLLHWAKVYHLDQIKDFVKSKPGQLETIRILTDGLPRTLKFFINVIVNRSQTDSYNYLKQIMDYVTNLYQERLNNLPPVHRKIILNLAFIWEAASVKQLAQVCRIESKLLSAHLKQLYHNGLVDTIETSKKNHLYRISERFFNLWLIFTQGSQRDKRKQKCLTIFLENWYDEKEIREMAVTHLKSLDTNPGNGDDAALFSKTLAHSRFITIDVRDQIIEKTLQLNNISPSLKESLPEKARQIINQIGLLIDQKKYKEAIELVENIEQNDGTKENLLGKIFYDQKDLINAKKYLKKSVSKGKKIALLGLAFVNERLSNFDEALRYYKKAKDADDVYGYLGLAKLYYRLGIEKTEALEMITIYNSAQTGKKANALQIAVEVWNGILDNLIIKVQRVLEEEPERTDYIIENLLIHHQKNLVQGLFINETIGEKLRQEHSLYNYVLQLLNDGGNVDETLLKMPPEIRETVDEMVSIIKQRQKILY